MHALWVSWIEPLEARPAALRTRERAQRVVRRGLLGALQSKPVQSERRAFPILYVDDDADNVIVFRSNFSPEFEVLTARSGPEALQVLRSARVSILVTDQRMPGLTGVELCERVRRDHPWIRRILLTAYGDLRTAIDAINRGGVHSFLSKPWEKEVLRQALEAQLEPLQLQAKVSALRRALDERTAEATRAASQQRLLHDLGGLLQRLDLRSRKLLRQLEVGDAALASARASTLEVRKVVEHLVQLHAQLGAPGVRSIPLAPERLRVRELLQTVGELTGIAHGAVIRYRISCPDELSVWADRISLIRVLINLVANAREAIERARQPDGEICIDVVGEGDAVRLDVSDNGPGVPEGLRARIFEDHFTTRKAEGGSGIGLSSARALAEACGGSLVLVQSARGATFRLIVPAQAQPARHHSNSSPLPPPR